jgi:hypothetical protein
MSFFVTSSGNGPRGGDFGGIDGADAKCRSLGPAGRTWRAYLSTTATSARDRIGTGPWFNFAGVEIAASIAALHDSPPDWTLIVDETGTRPPREQHDIVTGSDGAGRARVGELCNEWTDGTAASTTVVGHSDWNQPEPGATQTSWNSSHTAGCDEADLRAKFGVARLYCFATD